MKWFVDEEASDMARRVRDHFVTGRIELASPQLLKYELANALRGHPIVRIDRRAFTDILVAIDDYQFLIDPPREAWRRAADLSFDHGISLYDAIYVGTASVLKARLLTADEKMLRALPARAQDNVTPLRKLRLEGDEISLQ